jgi:hypothetical protein
MNTDANATGCSKKSRIRATNEYVRGRRLLVERTWLTWFHMGA